MSSTIIDRIITKSGYEGLLQWLSEELSGAEFQSLLLEVLRRRAGRQTAKDLLKSYKENRFVQPSRIAPEVLFELDRLAFRLRGTFEPVELSPLAPMGSCSALAPVHQNNVVSALRQTEVVSDPTNVLALEIARRRKEQKQKPDRRHERIQLMCAHRATRAQAFDNPAFSAHFRLLCLCSGGRDTGYFSFETEQALEHLRFYLRLLEESKQLGCRPGPVKVRFADFNGGSLRETFEERVLSPLKTEFPAGDFDLYENPESGRGYYRSFRFNILLTLSSGEPILLIDGGDTDWTQQLLSDRKERLLTSGMGTQLYAQVFG